ncbi:pectate lyase family protein [Treponema berlinense]|uniref:pectate lyase family protein n=1 Tax=Treponema berlinense TaxID=225004 RepID=UPI003FD87ACF
MKKNSQKRKFGTILLSLAALFAVLFSTVACKTNSDEDELNSVTISPSEATINANEQTSLSAKVDKKGSGTPVYKWEITSGSEYAKLENATSSTCVVTGKNTTASAQSVKVKCTVTFASNTKSAEAIVTVSAANAELKSVSIAGSEEIASKAETDLTATPAFTVEGVSPVVTYTWEIIEGGDYAILSSTTGSSVTLTGKNTTGSEQSVTVKVSATYGGTTKESTKTVKILAEGQTVENKVTSVSVSAEISSIACDGNTTLTAKAEYSGNPEISYTWEIIEGVEYATLSSTTGSSVILTGKNTTESDQSVTVNVSATDGTNTETATKTVTVQKKVAATGNVIKASDVPEGFASIDVSKFATVREVSTKAELVSYAKKGGHLIYITKDIDMTEGMLPTTPGGTTSALDSFVKTNTSSKYSTYESFKTAYAKSCSSTTEDKSSSSPESSLGSTLWSLNRTYGNSIKIDVKSNTAIIGVGDVSIKGGSVKIGSGVSNVVIRNINFKDAYDPFPHHEKDDGFNAQHDNVVVEGASNVWIDHCTFEDTMYYSKVTISDGSEEKWQTYDGLCDIKSSSKNVVVSYNIFKNHDKTMLIGSSKSDKAGGYITISNNLFYNCGQRLPLTCYANMHIFNNYYNRDSEAKYSQNACIAARYDVYTIVAENNYFGSNIKKAITPSSEAAGKCYQSGNYFAEGESTACTIDTTTTKPFTPSYTYSLLSASEAKTNAESNAGAGTWTVER